MQRAATGTRESPAVDASVDSLVGRCLEGRYRILERIACGGMSTVYAAVDERLDRLVAVKVMSSALSADPAFTDRFVREARAAARLTHLNAVSVFDQGHDIGPDGHHVFLVMELVEGRTLRELLRERGRLTPAEAVSIMEPVLSALSAAHRAGLVHRDVKPENMLLSDDGVVKVADFGLAHAVEADAASTRTGLMMGTVAYCAPEQISRGSADPRSDVYAAGVVLFELLTGEPPYRGDSAMTVAYQHVHSRVPAPSSRVRGIPNEIDELVVAATDSDPTGRPADASAFLAEIADVRAALSLAVTPVPPRPRSRGRRSPGPDALDAERSAAGPLGALADGAQASTRRLGGNAASDATTSAIRTRGGHEAVASRHHDTVASRHHDTVVVPRRGMQAPLRDGRSNVYPHGSYSHGGGAHVAAIPPSPRTPANGAPPPVTRALQRRRRRLRGLLVLLLLLALGAAAGYGGWYFAAGRYSRVPQLRGATKAAAVSRLQDAGYAVGMQPGPEYDEAVPKGEVRRTVPSADIRAVRGTTIDVVLSAGPHFYLVRPVAGEAPEDARQVLQSVGPVSVADAVRQEPSDSVPAGAVTRTVPAAGTQVRAQQVVRLYVSSGPPMVGVPPIAPGSDVTTARALLHKAHLRLHTQNRYSDSIAPGEIVSCAPSRQVRKFSTVTCAVSQGPEMVIIPDIASGSAVDDASAALISAGLVPDVRTFGGVDASAATVIGVAPACGSRVHTGSTVTVYGAAP